MIIYAVNVNTGGGKVLLDRLLIQNPFEPTSAAFLDARYTPPQKFMGKKFFFSIMSRLLGEIVLHKLINSKARTESILFFGNLPPFRRAKTKSYLYLQNCYLTRQMPLPTDTFRELLRNWTESWILKLFYQNVDEIWVQSNWMKQLTTKHCPKANIVVRPFLPLLPEPKPESIKKIHFTYVGSLSKNKGLLYFISALQRLDNCISSKITAYAILNNTTKEGLKLEAIARDLKNVSLNIRCQVDRQDLFTIYESTEYLVITSLYESYYLPAYEASHFKCKILARNDAEYMKNDQLINNNITFFDITNLNLQDYLDKK